MHTYLVQSLVVSMTSGVWHCPQQSTHWLQNNYIRDWMQKQVKDFKCAHDSKYKKLHCQVAIVIQRVTGCRRKSFSSQRYPELFKLLNEDN